MDFFFSSKNQAKGQTLIWIHVYQNTSLFPDTTTWTWFLSGFILFSQFCFSLFVVVFCFGFFGGFWGVFFINKVLVVYLFDCGFPQLITMSTKPVTLHLYRHTILSDWNNECGAYHNLTFLLKDLVV